MIDKPGTVDRDDAIWCESAGDGWDAVVHIACFADVVPTGGSVDLQAARRMRTIYLPNKVVPMLPRPVEDAATLHPDHTRASVSVNFHINADGTVSDAHVAQGRLSGGVAMDYAQATAALTNETHP
jgi:exoribonuclease R